MKGSCTLVATILAASTVALSSSSAGDRDVAYAPSSSKQGLTWSNGTQNGGVGANTCSTTSDNGKFAPRYDGLRFIETLVTAHR